MHAYTSKCNKVHVYKFNGAEGQKGKPIGLVHSKIFPRRALNRICPLPNKEQDQDLEYKSSVSLHGPEYDERLLRQLRRQQEPLAIIILAPKNNMYPGTEIQVPILKRTERAKTAVATHIDGTIYQFGATEVRNVQNTVAVTLGLAHNVAWILGLR